MASRSLGSLTLDLVAKTAGFTQGMDKAERSSAKWKRQVKRDLNDISKAFKVASAAAVAGLTAITVQTVRAADEVQRFSTLAGTTTEDFQKYSAGAKALGIEQEKLADIFKDTSDKVGDFLQTGAGPLADFFENIAPKVGVTAEQFKELSGPQALELYVSSLEEANLSQNEMVFFLEAIASDAAVLLPLLKNNATGFKAFGAAAEEAGNILDQKTIKAANELNAAIFLSQQAFGGFKNQIASELLPTLSDFAVLLFDVSEAGTVASAVGEFVSDSLKGITATATGAVAAIDLFGKTLGGIAAVVAAIPDGLSAISKTFKAVREDLNETALDYADTIDQIWAAGDRDSELNVTSRLKELAVLLEEARKITKTTSDATLSQYQSNLKLNDSYKDGEEALKARNGLLKNTQTLLGDLSDVSKVFAGEQSATYRALFALEKSVSIARSIVAIKTGIALAAANPFPKNLAAIASITSATAGLVSDIGGVSIKGVAHDGIDKIPTTGTYLLEKGERVTTEKTSKKLDRTLDEVKANTSSGGGSNSNVVVHNYSGQPVQTMSKKDVVEIVVGEMSNQTSRSRKALSATSNTVSRGL